MNNRHFRSLIDINTQEFIRIIHKAIEYKKLDKIEEKGPPFDANWEILPERVTHSFTHFNLILTVYKAQIDKLPVNFCSYNLSESLLNTLPTLSKKVLRLISDF